MHYLIDTSYAPACKALKQFLRKKGFKKLLIFHNLWSATPGPLLGGGPHEVFVCRSVCIFRSKALNLKHFNDVGCNFRLFIIIFDRSIQVSQYSKSNHNHKVNQITNSCKFFDSTLSKYLNVLLFNRKSCV